MTPAETSWAYSLGAVAAMVTLVAIQRYITRRYVRNHLREERRRECAYERRPVVVLYEELEAELDRLAPLYPEVTAAKTDRWS